VLGLIVDANTVAEDGDCSFELMKDREYLPTQAVLAAGRERARHGDVLTADLLQRITALQQTPTACSRARAAHFPNHGAAATMNYLVIQLKRGLRDQRPIAFTGSWIYGGCPAQDFSCLFLAETACNVSIASTAGNGGAVHDSDSETRDWALQSHGIHERLGGQGRGGVYPERLQEVDPDFVLPLYRAEGKGIFWYNSVVTGYMFRLLPLIAQQVQDQLHSLGLANTSFVGVQVTLRVHCLLNSTAF